MKSQKTAVIDEVLAQVPTFVKYKDKALVVLTHSQLEAIKTNIQVGISTGAIKYSKDPTNLAEVRTYARSMVSNHLKKSTELNGNLVAGQSSVSGGATPKKLKDTKTKGIDLTILPDDLKEYIQKIL